MSKAKTAAKVDTTIARDLRAMYRVDPTKARQMILDGFTKTGGNAVHAAEALGVSHRTVMRFLETDPSLATAVDKIRARSKKDKAEAS